MPFVRAWRPAVAGVTEVLHATMTGYSYPAHCHDVWTVLLVDEGAVGYDLDRHRFATATTSVNILPPHVVHDGRPLGAGFRKRVLYLDETWLPSALIGKAVDHSIIEDPALHRIVDRVHVTLQHGDDLAAETLLRSAAERIRLRLGALQEVGVVERATAHRLRSFLDEHAFESVTLATAAAALDRHPTHLARSFSEAFGMSPHAYLTSRRVAAARRMLLDGLAPATVAVTVGFHDQAHLTRHFRRHTSTTPARFASGPLAVMLPRNGDDRRQRAAGDPDGASER